MKKKISIIAVLAIIVLLLSAGSVFADLEVDSPALTAPAPVSEEILTEDEITNMVTTELITARTKTSSDVYKADQNVNLKGEEDLIGKIVTVKILEARTWSLNGEYLK